jgi:hypothetical protein
MRKLFGTKIFGPNFFVVANLIENRFARKHFLEEIFTRNFLWLQNHFLENRFRRKNFCEKFLGRQFFYCCKIISSKTIMQIGRKFFMVAKSFP